MQASDRIYVAGHTGMVGTAICRELKSRGYQNLITVGHRELDLTEQAVTRAFIQRERPDCIIFAAARVGGIEANRSLIGTFLYENLMASANVIHAAHEAGVKRLLFLGSTCIYPRLAPQPIPEESLLTGPLEPTNEGYALAKIFAMKLCEYIQKEDSRFEYKTLIPCNLYGEHDKFAPEHSHLIPAIIHKIHLAKVNGLSKVEIWGDGKARREFMLASDLADCVMTCVEQFSKVPNLMNVGLGFDYSVNEFYQTAAKVIGYQGEFYHDLSKPTGMQQKLVSVSRLTEFGWKPKTTLADGMKKTYEFYLKQFNE